MLTAYNQRWPKLSTLTASPRPRRFNVSGIAAFKERQNNTSAWDCYGRARSEPGCTWSMHQDGEAIKMLLQSLPDNDHIRRFGGLSYKGVQPLHTAECALRW